MDIWSSIRDWCFQYRPDLQRYGVAVLLVLAAMYKGLWVLACLILFVAIPIIYAYDRWGGPWQAKGARMIFKPKPKK